MTTTPTPRVEHWCRLERAPSGLSLSRSVCTCGWTGEWLLSDQTCSAGCPESPPTCWPAGSRRWRPTASWYARHEPGPTGRWSTDDSTGRGAPARPRRLGTLGCRRHAGGTRMRGRHRRLAGGFLRVAAQGGTPPQRRGSVTYEVRVGSAVAHATVTGSEINVKPGGHPRARPGRSRRTGIP